MKPKSKPKPSKASASIAARPPTPMWLPALLLALATIVLYWPATRCDFITFDDELYVTSNFHVQQGLSLESIKWAFVNTVDGNWHPLTMLSHMLDCQLYGLNPWGHHLTSVLLHVVNTALVFILLRRLTGVLWRSVFVAAFFGLHPLHVESVAWVAERKDVLSTCFGLLSLVFYSHYAKKSRPIENLKSKPGQVATLDMRLAILNYTLALLFFACGLMSKPMLVTWPFVMLLLDFWPLARFKHTSIWRLVGEKIPFFALAAAASVVTFLVQKHTGAVVTMERLPFVARFENALVSYCRYLGKLFWPTDLAIVYPHPGYWPLPWVLASSVALAGISVLLWMKRRKWPFMLMGWLWFCGTLVPVIGLVQVGEQSMADRYTYIPSLGIFILVVWGAYEMTRHQQLKVMAISAAGCVALILCCGLTRQQLGFWQDTEILMRRALAVTKNNYAAHNNLGYALYKKGEFDEAIQQYQDAIQLDPRYAQAQNNLGNALGANGQFDAAIQPLQEAIRLDPSYAGAYNNLGVALDRKGEFDDAIRQFQEALRLDPDNAEAYNNLASALDSKGQIEEAIQQYQKAIQLNPGYAEAHNNLGNVLNNQGKLDEAIPQYQEAIRLNANYAEAYNNLGGALYNEGHVDEAINRFQEAIRLKPDDAEAYNNLGIALGGKGQLDAAISQFQEALRMKPDFAQARNNLARALQMKNAPTNH